MKSWQLIFTDSDNRRAARFLKRHPELQPSYRKGLHFVSINLSTSSCTKLRNWGLSLNCL
jgi:hypothetical protein